MKKRKLTVLLIAVVGAGLTLYLSKKYKNFFSPATPGMEQLSADSVVKQLEAENKLFERVLARIEENEPKQAAAMMDSALKANPRRGIYYSYRGMVYGSAGEDSAALEYYNKAMEIGGRYPLVLYNRGQSLIRLGQFEMGIANMKEAAEKNVDYEFMIAKMYEQHKHIDSAIVYLKKYVGHKPEATAARIHLDSLVANKK